MGIGFSQRAELCMQGVIAADFCAGLPNAIFQHTGIAYFSAETKDGCILKPNFHNMPYRNSFVPEITVEVSEKEGGTTLLLTGQPVMGVHIFLCVWFAFFLAVGVILLANGCADRILFALLPLILGFSLCKITTKITFHTVLKAIRKEYP